MESTDTYMADLSWGNSSAVVTDDRPDAFAHNVSRQIESWVSSSSGLNNIEIKITVIKSNE